MDQILFGESNFSTFANLTLALLDEVKPIPRLNSKLVIDIKTLSHKVPAALSPQPAGD